MEIEKKRAVIKAALLAATAGMAVTAAANAQASGSGGGVEQSQLLVGEVPWGEVIIGPIWEQRNPPKLTHVTEAAATNPSFWKW